jgi:hypothetical protein
VDFIAAAGGSPERARITLDPSYLVPDGTASANIDQGIITAAWRSIAELANCSAVQLRGQFRRLDFAQAIAAARTNDAPVNLFDGMVPVVPYEAPTTAWAFPDTNADGSPGIRQRPRAGLPAARFHRHL